MGINGGFKSRGVCGAIKSGASEVQRFPQACLRRFVAAEWQTLDPSISCGFNGVLKRKFSILRYFTGN